MLQLMRHSSSVNSWRLVVLGRSIHTDSGMVS
jgi:hypothetical protein